MNVFAVKHKFKSLKEFNDPKLLISNKNGKFIQGDAGNDDFDAFKRI